MVKIGFICEGPSESIFLKSEKFLEYLLSLNIEYVGAISVRGISNLLKYNDETQSKFNILIDRQARYIIVLADLDEQPCISQAKELFHKFSDSQIVILAVKTFEAWFLADSETMSQILRKNFNYDYPEDKIKKPFDVIKEHLNSANLRGPGTKPLLAKRMLRYGFTVNKAAEHSKCKSAKYFVNKLESLSKEAQ